jgi:hypothetical protein
MADHRKLSHGNFKNLLDNISDKAGGTPEDYGLNASLITEVNTSRTAIAAGIADQLEKKAAAKAATTALTQLRKDGDDLGSRIKAEMRRAGMPPEKFEELGFDADDSTPSPIGVQTPTDLTAQGASNGTNSMKFNRNDNKKGTIFIIEAKIGAATDYVMVGTTTKTSFNHTGQKPGVKAMYRVRAQRGEQFSEYSNEAVVYG